MKFHVSQRAHVSSGTWSPMTTQNDARNMTALPSPQFMFTVYEHVSKPLCDKLDLILAEMKKQTSMVTQSGCEQTAIVEVGQKRPRQSDSDSDPSPEPEHEPEPEQVYDMVTDDEEEQQEEAKSAETFATETLATLRTYSSDERVRFFTKFISELPVAECRVVRDRVAERPSVTYSATEFRRGERVWFRNSKHNDVRLNGTVLKSASEGMKKNLLIKTDLNDNQTKSMGGGLRWTVSALNVYRQR